MVRVKYLRIIASLHPLVLPDGNMSALAWLAQNFGIESNSLGTPGGSARNTRTRRNISFSAEPLRWRLRQSC